MNMRIIVTILIYILAFYFGITTMIYRFHNQKMTETQLFLNAPHALVLDFKTNNSAE